MADHHLFFSLLLLTLVGCGVPLSDRPQPDEPEARRHLSLAESLEKASALQEATFEYTFVAEHFPSTNYYLEAVRKAALLYSMPSNPAANEISALRWMQIYLTLPLSEEEMRHVELHIALLRRVQSLEDAIARERNLRQKLSALAIRRGTDLLDLAKRIQELEFALQQAAQELEKLKEVDLQTSRIRIKK